MKKSHLFILVLMFSINPIIAQNKTNANTPITIGEQLNIESSILDTNRIVNIYLPHGYHKDSLKTYPVIYLLDGSLDEDFIHISGLVQFGSFSWVNLIPESIVVGISNIDRKKDFTFPSKSKRDQEEFPTTGASGNFIDFIEKELQPLIDKKYNTNSTKTIIGQSLGGLLATEILLKKPDLFDNYIIISPSLWWDNESLLKVTPKAFQTSKSIFVGVGKEGKVMERTAKELYKLLDYSKNDSTIVFFNFFEKQDHGDVLHLAVYQAFEKIFSEDK